MFFFIVLASFFSISSGGMNSVMREIDRLSMEFRQLGMRANGMDLDNSLDLPIPKYPEDPVQAINLVIDLEKNLLAMFKDLRQISEKELQRVRNIKLQLQQNDTPLKGLFSEINELTVKYNVKNLDKVEELILLQLSNLTEDKLARGDLKIKKFLYLSGQKSASPDFFTLIKYIIFSRIRFQESIYNNRQKGRVPSTLPENRANYTGMKDKIAIANNIDIMATYDRQLFILYDFLSVEQVERLRPYFQLPSLTGLLQIKAQNDIHPLFENSNTMKLLTPCQANSIDWGDLLRILSDKQYLDLSSNFDQLTLPLDPAPKKKKRRAKTKKAALAVECVSPDHNVSVSNQASHESACAVLLEPPAASEAPCEEVDANNSSNLEISDEAKCSSQARAMEYDVDAQNAALELVRDPKEDAETKHLLPVKAEPQLANPQAPKTRKSRPISSQKIQLNKKTINAYLALFNKCATPTALTWKVFSKLFTFMGGKIIPGSGGTLRKLFFDVNVKQEDAVSGHNLTGFVHEPHAIAKGILGHEAKYLLREHFTRWGLAPEQGNVIY